MARLNSREADVKNAKWLANVAYNSDDGRRVVCYSFIRPEELAELIEAAQERNRILEVEILLIDDLR